MSRPSQTAVIDLFTKQPFHPVTTGEDLQHTSLHTIQSTLDDAGWALTNTGPSRFLLTNTYGQSAILAKIGGTWHLATEIINHQNTLQSILKEISA